jgi:hypothetical protein
VLPGIEALTILAETDDGGASERAILECFGRWTAVKIDHKALGPVGGAAIKLSDDADVTMGLIIGEGLETTLAATVFGLAPAWALGSAGGHPASAPFA